jgi:hypothetical protein
VVLRQQQREPNDAIVVGELDVIRDHAMPKSKTSSGKLSGDAGVHGIVVARVRLQLVANQGRQKLFVRDFLTSRRGEGANDRLRRDVPAP